MNGNAGQVDGRIARPGCGATRYRGLFAHRPLPDSGPIANIR
ncbi:hypothetical protein BSIN_3510 [Burkholderia singularis]|uniref:Uncharacterized protein n=1 Tax=Burkholderia singularis TaxID=1503053 RepID=A0A238H5T8_9BURK|nr:hypothetical protein BSIN_3510 [Burkholderia singularis]